MLVTELARGHHREPGPKCRHAIDDDDFRHIAQFRDETSQQFVGESDSPTYFRVLQGADRVVPLATLKRRTRLKPHESEKTERLARVIALAELSWDDQPAAQQFLSAPHPELDGRTPLECAASEIGARQLEEVVMRALYGLPV